MLCIKRLNSTASLPTRAYSESAGYDLAAYLLTGVNHHPFTLIIPPNTVKPVPTGLAILAPPSHLIQICSRSGLAARGIFVANAPGIVDPDYTGEIQVLLFNGGQFPHYVKHGDRIAQLIVVPFAKCELSIVESFPETERGSKGFGSSGD